MLFEDSAAMLGLIAAVVGIFLGHHFENPYFDGADAATLQSIKRLAESDPAIAKVERPLTMYFGPHTVVLTMDVEFREKLSGSERDVAVQRLEEAIRVKHRDISRIFIESKSLAEKMPGKIPDEK